MAMTATMAMGQFVWPKVFTDPNYDTFYTKNYPNIKQRCLHARADGISGWALCMCVEDLPRYFGHAMYEIGQILGIKPTLENLRNYHLF